MKVSVVISTYSPKKPETLFKLLESLYGQSYGDLEVLVAVDVNKALSEQIAGVMREKYGDRPMRTIFNEENKGLSCSRNAGVLNATGEVIAFIDDDAIPDKDWISRIVETFNKYPEAAAVVGDTLPGWERGDLAWFPKELYWIISCSYTMTPTSEQEVERGFGVNMAFKKDALIDAGMFSPDFGISGKRWLGGDEIVMFMNIRRRGKKIIFNPRVIVHHDVYANRTAYRNVVKRAYNQGITVGLYKSLPYYNIRNSTENTYLKSLLFEFYPHAVARFFRTLSLTEIKKMAFVTSVIMAQGTGYAYSSVAEWLKRTFKGAGTSSPR